MLVSIHNPRELRDTFQGESEEEAEGTFSNTNPFLSLSFSLCYPTRDPVIPVNISVPCLPDMNPDCTIPPTNTNSIP